jgi:hypothetical protein
MKWPWPPIGLRDFVGAAIVLAVLGIFVFLTVGNPKFLQQATNAGFGPDWECTRTGVSEPVCVKRIDTAK